MADSQPNSVIRIDRSGGAPIEIGNDRKLVLLAGPCALESREHALEVSGRLKEIADRLDIGLVYNVIRQGEPDQPVERARHRS